jgi:cysteinyl-tRNA synthetase
VGEDDLHEMLSVLALDNLLESAPVEIPPQVIELADARDRARAERNWAEADRIRDQLRSMGWEVRDGPDGPELLPAA